MRFWLPLFVIALSSPLFAEDEAPSRLPALAEKLKRAIVLQTEVAQALIGRSGAANLYESTRTDPDDDRERLLLLTPGGPILLEMRITIDGRPFRHARLELLKKTMESADTDGDGRVTWMEALGRPGFAGGRFASLKQIPPEALKQYLKTLDPNQNGLVDPSELSNLFGGGPFGLQPAGFGLNMQPAILEILDTNQDHALSEAELNAAAERLQARDANANELLDAAELGGQSFGRAGGVAVVNGGFRQPPAGAILIGPGTPGDFVLKSLQDRYKPADGQMTSQQFRLAPALFEALDIDRDGKLAAAEMTALLVVAPQIALQVKLGTKEIHEEVTVAQLSFANVPDQPARAAGQPLQILLPGVEIECAAQMTIYASNLEMQAKRYMTQLDDDKNGYLDKKEMQKFGGANNQFAQMDRDGDEKVYQEEMSQFYRDMQAPSYTRVAASVANLGQSLFAILDQTGDQRLSLRELKQCADRLRTLDQNRDGQLSGTEIPARFRLQFGLGFVPNGAQYAIVRTVGGVIPGAAPAPKSNDPEWFTRMDRNSDGDLTPREFLGSPEQFQQLDLNRDGFIESAEARKAEQPTR